MTGSVTSLRAARLSTAVAGLVSTLAVDVGDRVSAGDALLQLDDALALHDHQSARAAVRRAEAEAADARLRPIAMSTLTTVCGLAPLVFLPGEGTELYRGLGAIVLFGILGATLVSLTALPALASLVLARGRRSCESAGADAQLW